MVLCPSCGAENADGMRFCVKCGGGLAEPASAPGSWQQPSGNLGATPYDTPSGGAGAGRGTGDFGQPGPYAPPPVSYGGGYGGAVTSAGINGQPYALWADRVLAFLIDGALVFAVMIGLYLVFAIIGGVLAGIGGGIGGDAGGAVGTLGCGTIDLAMIMTPIATLIVGLYNKLYLISSRGYSIGQGMMNLKVVMGDGSAVSMNTSVIRYLVQIGFSIIPILPLLSILWPLWDPQRQTLHDKAVGTFVVKRG